MSIHDTNADPRPNQGLRISKDENAVRGDVAAAIAAARAHLGRAEHELRDGAGMSLAFGDQLVGAGELLALAADLLLADARKLSTAELLPGLHSADQLVSPIADAQVLHSEQQTLDSTFDAHLRLPLSRLIYAEVCEAGDRLRGLAAAFEQHPQLRSFAVDVTELHARLERVGIQAIEHVAKGTTDASE